MLDDVLDIHTHHRGRHGAVYSATPAEALAIHADGASTQLYSLALHPMCLSDGVVADFMRAVATCHGDPRWRAVGECGLDRRSAVGDATQRTAFVAALRVARREALPTVVHCVGRWQELEECVAAVWPDGGAEAAFRAGCPIVIHGFAKKADLARQLLRHGFCVSLGAHFNPEVARLVPAARLYVETDESAVPVDAIRAAVRAARQPE